MWLLGVIYLVTGKSEKAKHVHLSLGIKGTFPPKNQNRKMVEIVKIIRLEILFMYAVTYETIYMSTHKLHIQVYRYITPQD